MTKVPGQAGPYIRLTERECAAALKAIVEREGAANLVEELHRWLRKRKVEDTAALFDSLTAGMTYGPASVVRGLKEAVESGIADNYTFHFAMTAIVYAMALEKLDPEFFKEKRHVPPDNAAYEKRRQEIMEYVRRLVATEDTTS